MLSLPQSLIRSFLYSNDKNLCSKALLSGVKALSKNDLEVEVGRSAHGFRPLQTIKPLIGPQVSSPMLSTNYTSVQPHSQERTGLSVGLTEKGEPGINVFFLQNRKSLGILHHRLLVHCTCTCHVCPSLPSLLCFTQSVLGVQVR